MALAFGADSLRTHLQASALAPFTPHTITGRARLAAEVAATRARGWAVAPGEVLLGINALAVPVVDGGGGFVATLAAVGLMQSVGQVPKKAQVVAMQQAAAAITQALMAIAGEAPRGR